MRTQKNSGHVPIAILTAMLLAPLSAPPLRGEIEPKPLVAADRTLDLFDLFAGDARDDSRYSEGTRAIQESRWADAESIFAEIAARRGEHAEGALYWKAFAESRQGKDDVALKTCGELRQGSPKSRWIDDCGALEIEIRGRNGQPVDPQSQQDENLKLLALNALMRQDESKALPQIEQILAGNQPETFKEHALFVLAKSDSTRARKMLAQVANPGADAPAGIQSNMALRQRAQQLLAAQSASTASAPTSHRVGIDVVVTDAAGKPVHGLNAEDFTLLDNNQPQAIQGFHAMSNSVSRTGESLDPPTEVMILIDTINMGLPNYPYVRDEVIAYLKHNGGELLHPTSVFIFDGKDALRLTAATRDGNVLADALQKAGTGARPIRRSSGAVGILPRAQMSLAELGSLAVEDASKPGRKMLLWISPGWDTSGLDDDFLLDEMPNREEAPLFRTRKAMFNAIVALSTGLRQARIQLYCIKPDHTAGAGATIWSRYQLHLKGVTNADKAGTGNLGLQVLAVQSGGDAVNNTNQYLSGVIAQTVESAEADYFLSFNAPAAERADEFHSLKITVNKPGLTVRTRHGYYDQP